MGIAQAIVEAEKAIKDLPSIKDAARAIGEENHLLFKAEFLKKRDAWEKPIALGTAKALLSSLSNRDQTLWPYSPPYIARLVGERLFTVFGGWQDPFERLPPDRFCKKLQSDVNAALKSREKRRIYATGHVVKKYLKDGFIGEPPALHFINSVNNEWDQLESDIHETLPDFKAWLEKMSAFDTELHTERRTAKKTTLLIFHDLERKSVSPEALLSHRQQVMPAFASIHMASQLFLLVPNDLDPTKNLSGSVFLEKLFGFAEMAKIALPPSFPSDPAGLDIKKAAIDPLALR